MAPHSSTLALENPMDGGAWWAAVHGMAKSRTQLSDLTFTFHSQALEKEMATHSSILAGESQGRRSLVGCRVQGRTESDTTKATQQQQQQQPSFIWTSVFLVCSSICVIFLCLFIIFLFQLIVFEVSFSQASRLNVILPFGFCPPEVGPGVCVSFVQGEICAQFLFVCLFFPDRQG